MKKAVRYSQEFKDKVIADQAMSITAVCKKYRINRSTYYQWKEESQATQAKKSARTDRNIKELVSLIEKNPQASINQYYQELKDLRGNAVRSRGWIQKQLHKLDLSVVGKRILFASAKNKKNLQIRKTYANVSKEEKMSLKEKVGYKTSAEFRAKFISLVKDGYSINSVCNALGINRSTYYKWIESLNSSSSITSAIRGRKSRIDSRVIKIVMDIIKIYPQWGVDQIYTYINEGAATRLISRASIQKLLQKNKLSTRTKRMQYSYLHTPPSNVITTIEAPQVITLPQERQLIRSRGDPSPPQASFNHLEFSNPSAFIKSFFSQQTVQELQHTDKVYLSATAFVSIINAYLFSRIINAVIMADTLGAKIGTVFSSIALFCGLFFFIYSVKYYITIAAVLLKSNTGSSLKSSGLFKSALNTIKAIPFIGQYLSSKLNSPVDQSIDPVSLHKQVQEMELTEYPFFSVQIPLYNEKKVANRVTTAAASMEYPNFEVLVCDDSTDETTQLLYDKWSGSDKVKILHRVNRSGFKGAALDNALKVMDPRTEYVVVFDADFVPYPDTLTLFAKYFKVIGEKEGLNISASELYNTIKGAEASANNLSNATQYQGKTVAVQGYQWHVLNKSENWITRAVRSEFAGSYIIERSGGQVFGLLKQIAGSVYAINASVLKEVGWGTSITEDFQLTLKLYEQGYKVAYTPYIQAPSECVSTLKRLIRQRQRWAEGHSFNIKKRIFEMLRTPNMTVKEKWEAVYLTPYYLQSFIFILGSVCWIIAETILRVKLPFWTSALGWSLVLTNLFSLPLMNTIGLFLEEGEERDYLGIFSFITLCYVLAPFIGFAALKGFLEKEEGPWFRTPKSGHITDKVSRERKREKIAKLIPWMQPAINIINGISKRNTESSPYLAYATAGSDFSQLRGSHGQGSKLRKRLAHLSIIVVLSITVLANIAQTTVPQAFANPDTYYMKTTTADNLTDAATDKRLQGSTTIGASTTTQTVSSTNPTLYMITDNLNKRWTADTEINDTNTAGDRRNPAIATDSSGNTVAVWEDSRNTDSSQNQITASTRNMTIARGNAAVAPLLDGRVLFVGGSSTATLASSTAEVYDPVTATFTLIASGAISTARHYAKAVTLNDGRVLVTGGMSGSYASLTGATSIYDPYANSLTAGTAMSANRVFFSMVKLNNGKVLVSGGCSVYDNINSQCTTALSTSELYDPATATWTLAGSMSTTRLYHGSTLLPNGEVLVSGGEGPLSATLTTSEIFNPVTLTWRLTGAMTTTHSPLALALSSDKVIASGGGTSISEIYDPSSQTWSVTRNYLHPNVMYANTLVPLGNGKVLAVGGQEDVNLGSHSSSTAEVYDPITQTWTLTTNSLPTAKDGISPVLLPNGNVLIAGGGGSADTFYSSAALYSPITYDIYAQKYDKTGAKLWNSGTDIRVNTDDGNRVSSSGPPNYNHLNPSVGIDGSGNAIVAWEEQRQGVFNSTVWSQKLNSSDGSKLWPNGTRNGFSIVPSTLTYRRTGTTGNSASTVPLNNGKILIAGTEGSGGGRSIVELYDPIANTFATGPQSGYIRINATVTPLMSGKMLLFGGSTSTVANTAAELYDPVANTLTLTTGGMVAVRNIAPGTLLKNGKVFIVGSGTASAAASQSEIYDPITNTFANGPVLRFSRRSHNQVLLPNGKVLIVGSIDAGGNTTPEIYDPITNTATLSAARSKTHSRGSAVLLNNGKVLLIGTASNTVSASELYDPATDTITAAGSNIKAIDRTTVTPILMPNGKVLLPGGADQTPTGYSSTEIYDPATNTWSAGPNMVIQRQQAATSFVPEKGKILVMGGADVLENSTAELYTPIADMQVSQFDYRNNVQNPGMRPVASYPTVAKKPKVAIDTNGDAIIGWTDDSATLSQMQDLSHNYDTNARLSYGRNPAAISMCQNGTGCGAIPAISSPPVQIKAQKICNQASCGTAGTTSGERQWGNTNTTYYKNNPVDKAVASIKNSQNVNVIADGTTGVFVYDSDAGTTTDINTASKPDTKVSKIYTQKLDANGNTLWTSGWAAPTGGMVTNRRTQTTTLLPNGTVLLSGGQNAGILSSGEVHNPDTSTSTVATNNMTAGRMNHAATLLANGRVLITGGGTSSSTSSSTADLFTPSGNSGSYAATAGNMKVSRADHTSVLLRNGKVLLAGGRTATTATSTAEVFDSTTATAANVFTATTNNLTAGVRYGHRASLLPSGNVLIAGGTNGTGPLSSAEIYDDSTNTWSKTSIMVQKRSMYSLTLLTNGKVLAVGGCIAGNCTAGIANRTSSAELYDPLTNSWTVTGSLTISPRSEHSATLLPSGKVLIHGGTTDGTTFLSTSEIYDPSTGTFAAGSVAQTGRKDHDTVNLSNGRVMTFDGWDGTTAYSNAEIWGEDQLVSSSSSTNAKNPDLIKDSSGNIQIVWQAWRGEGLSPGASGGSWKVFNQETNNPSSGAITLQYPTGSTGTWSAFAGSLPAGRTKFVSTVLSSGKVLIAGGEGDTGAGSTADIFDPQSGTWQRTGNNIPNTLFIGYGISELTNGKVIAFGGQGGAGTAPKTRIYDPSANTWTLGNDMVSGRQFFGNAVTLNTGKVFVAGGYSDTATRIESSAELYDPATGTWTLATGTMSTARKLHRTVKLNDGRILVIGGCNSASSGNTCSANNTLSSTEIYSPTTGTFTASGFMTAERRSMNFTMLNTGKVLVWGGMNSAGTAVSTAEIFDPRTGTWSATTSAPNTSETDLGIQLSTLLPNGKVLGVRGSYGNETYIYDPVTTSWTTTGSVSSTRYNVPIIQLKNGKVLYAGGGPNTSYSSAEVYTPTLSEKLVSSDDSSLNANQIEPKISADSANAYSYVAWTDDRLTSPSDTTSEQNIYMQKLDGAGNPSWPNGLNENGTYNVRDVRIDTIRGSLNTTVQTKVALPKSVFTNTATDVPVQIAWMDTRDGTPTTSIYGQSYNTRNYSMSSTSWTAYYYVTGSPTSSNKINIQVGASEADGETMSYTSSVATYTGDGTNGQKSTLFTNLPPSGETSLTNRRLVMKLSFNQGSMQIQYNGAAATADTRLDVGIVVPERSLLLVLIIPGLPLLALGRYRRQKRYAQTVIHK